MLLKSMIVELLALGAIAAPTSNLAARQQTSGGQTPFKFPLSNGFPNIAPNSSALKDIQKAAHGTLPNTALPSSISSTSMTIFEFIAYNEIFEVAFFTELLNNVTSNVTGYEITVEGSSNTAVREIVIDALTAVQAQEQLHAIGANAILTTAGHAAIAPCEYIFPVDNFADAVAFASMFTDLVLGELQEVLEQIGSTGQIALTPLVGSIIGQEGEQNALYRVLEDPQGSRIPSALPFLTRASGAFGYGWINQQIIVPGSCPNASAIQLPIFEALEMTTSNVSASTSSINYSFSSNATSASDVSGYALVYVNQQNMPVVEQMSNVQVSNGMVTFSASFPYEQYEMNGLTIAAVTKGTGPYANATEVAGATVYGPALIEIN